MQWDMANPWLRNEAFLEASLRPVLAGLMERAALSPGARVLDVGCGTGPGLVRAAEDVGPGGRVTGVDISAPLLRRAAEKTPPHVDFIEGDAGRADYPEAGFDAVISNFGVMFFDDTRAAFTHLRATVPEDAPFDFVVWGGPEANPWFSSQRRAAVARFPDLPAPDPDGPGPMRFRDPAPLVRTLRAAGWLAEVETVDLHLEPPGDADAVAAAQMIMVAAQSLGDVGASDEDLEAVRSGMAEIYRDFEQDGVVRIPAQVHYIRARAV